MTEKPRFEPTINLGHIITLGGVICAIAGGWYAFDYRLTAIEGQVRMLSTVVIDNARMDERVRDHGRRLDNLERRP